jgi:hypothetical protein
MPVFTIQSPDGREIDVNAPDQDTAIKNAQEWVKANPKRAKAPEGSGDVSVGSVSRSLLRGIPFIGTYRDEATAKFRSMLPEGVLPEGFGKTGGSYEEHLETERAKDRAFADQHPYLDTGLSIAGGVGATALAAPAVAGAGVAATVGRTALGLGARTLPGAVARGATAGVLQGAAAGSGDAEGGFVDRAAGAGQGAAIGGVLGGTIPLGFEYLRRGGSAALNKFAGNGDALSGLSGGARRYVGELATPQNTQAWQQDLQRLGPDGMLADVSPEWQMVARGAAARPGSREVVVGALQGRNAGSNARLRADVDAAIGPAPIPSQVEEGLEASRAALQPAYQEALENATPVDTRGLARRLDATVNRERGPAQRAAAQVRQMLNSVRDPDALDMHPATLLNTRQAIDGMLATEADPNTIRMLTFVRREVDAELARNVPRIKQIDAQFQELSRQSGGLARGTNVLDTGRTAPRPQELAQEIQQGAQPEGQMVGPSATPMRMRQGLRAEIDRVIGTNGNDARAIQRTMRGSQAEGDWNPQKMGQLFGEDRARQVTDAVDREVTFQNTANRVTGGSDTASTRAFQEALDRAENGSALGGGAGGDLTVFGAVVRGARTIGGMLMGELGKARANRFATELARVSVAQGVDRDDLIQAMIRAGVRQQTVSRVLDHATRTGLIASREAPKLLQGQREPRSR